MSEQLALLPGYPSPPTSRLTLPPLLCSTAVSLPAGVAVTRVVWLERPVPGTAAVIQTVPSLAFLAVMVPLLAAVGLHSIGFLPAEVLRHGPLRSAPVLDGRAARQSPLQIWLAVATVIVAIRTFGAGVERSASNDDLREDLREMRDEGYRALRNDVTDLGERVRRPRSSFPGCGTDPDGRRWNAYTCYADRIVGRAVNRSRGHARRAGEVRNADHR